MSSHLDDFADTQAGAHQHAIGQTSDFKKRRLSVRRDRNLSFAQPRTDETSCSCSHSTPQHHTDLLTGIVSGSKSVDEATDQVGKYLTRAHVEYASYRAEVDASRSSIEGSVQGQSTGVKTGLETHEASLRASVKQSMGEVRSSPTSTEQCPAQC